ncbi:hypothetical protein N5F00_21955 [Pseudomonas chengduensis]|nr:hypothetical protein [Pseudomonas chengduensis]MDH1732171.1 hypothetical protein [Pseudomonas chengduensis]
MNQQPTIEERLEHAKQAMRDALFVLDKYIEDTWEHRERVREALAELNEVKE